MANVISSRKTGPTRSSSAATPSNAPQASSATWVTMMMRRRSTMSASAPAMNPNSRAGAVVAVCTSATMSGEGVSVAISHAATVPCIV